MTSSVSFKAYLKRDGQEVEVRRFGVDAGAATSYMYLHSKIKAMFPSIQTDQFQIFWQDSDNDYIKIDSDEELLEALTATNQRPLKVYIQIPSNQSQGGASGPSGQQTHPGIACDGCDGAVVGFRYKCVTCPDFDLCSQCEAKNLHSEHFMLRMPTPMNVFMHHSKFLRKMFSHPHKFHKRHGWSRHSVPRGCGDSQNGAGRCPFTRPGESPAAAAAAAFGNVTDMFDFSALMDFIESLGVATGEERASQSTNAGATAAPGTSQTANQASSGPQTKEQSQGERRQNTRETEYLSSIGRMVSTLLDPLGVDVTFDVRTKTPQPQQQPAAGAPSSESSASPSPAPAQAPATTATPATPPPMFVAGNPSLPTPMPAPAQPMTASTFSFYPNLVSSFATPSSEPKVPSTSSQTEAIPAATIETQTEPVRERRNSDDWTFLNRESPARSEATAMDVDKQVESQPKDGASNSTGAVAPSAPPQNDNPLDAERQRIQSAIETFRSMGFNFNNDVLREMLRRQNGDIMTVLEMMLTADKK